MTMMRARNLIVAASVLALSAGFGARAQDGEAFAPLPEAVEIAPGAGMPRAFEEIDWLAANYRRLIAQFAAYAPAQDEVVFFGDSITEGGDWAALFPGVETRNFGIGGDRGEGLLSRYGQVVATRPSRILILIGTNDLSNGDTPENIAFEVDQLLGRLKAELPDTALVVQSVLPRQPEFAPRIRDLNARLRAVAEDRGAAYVDIFSAFVVEGDRLDPAVTEDDLHLTPAGYARWRGLIEGCVTGEGACGA